MIVEEISTLLLSTNLLNCVFVDKTFVRLMLAALTTAKSFLWRDLPSKIIGSTLKLNFLWIEVLAYISGLLFLNATSRKHYTAIFTYI